MQSDSVMFLARDLMVDHGVGYLQFGFHHYPDRPGVVGRCHTVQHGPRLIPSKITLDSFWIEVLPEWKIRETILHEIAHALSPMSIKSNPHNGPWKENCFKLGIPAHPKFRWSGPVPNSVDTLVVPT